MRPETWLRLLAWAMQLSNLVKDARVACHERADPDREHDGDGQGQDAADDPGHRLAGVCGTLRCSASEGDEADDDGDEVCQQGKGQQLLSVLRSLALSSDL